MGIKKNAHVDRSASGIKKAPPPNPALRFSFRFFDAADQEICPPRFADGYVQTLMDRLKALSGWTVQEFLNARSAAVRSHPIDWTGTSRPKGFGLPEQYDAYPAYQFSVTANEHGRVHGLLIDDTFHVVWLDCDHRLYPKK